MEILPVDKAEKQLDKADKAFQFLIACLKHSKTDWVKLVEAENIVSVNAAKKRWKRLMDAYGPSDGCLSTSVPKAKGGAKARESPAKKRKFEEVEQEQEQEQEQEEEGEEGEQTEEGENEGEREDDLGI